MPGPVLAAVAHGEVLALSAFGSADGVVARGVSRLVTMPAAWTRMGWVCRRCSGCASAADYRAAAEAFASGSADGVARGSCFTCRALHAGAREALSIAERQGSIGEGATAT